MSNQENLSAFHMLAKLPVSNIQALVHRMAERMAELPDVREAGVRMADVEEAVMAREQQFSTAVGDGVLFPHARMANLTQISAVIATVEHPLEMPTPDGKKIVIACMMLIPEDQPMEGLKFLAHLTTPLRDEAFRRKIEHAATSDALFHVLSTVDFAPSETLFASDLMVPARCVVAIDTPLSVVTRKMAEAGVNVVPVLDGEKVVGEITTRRLFTLGVPEFFSQLKSVGFIRYFDPFKEYFQIEAEANAEQVMSREFFRCSEDATLIEIIFALSVQEYPQVYVVDAGSQLLGVINPALLLNRIVNL